MKIVGIFSSLLLISALSATADAHRRSRSRERHEYECGVKYYRYHLDNEPAEYGVVAGEYERGKKAYIGLSVLNGAFYQITRLQLKPPGVQLFNIIGSGHFINDSSIIWYLYNSRHHKRRWVDSKNGEIPPHAIEVGADRAGFPLLMGRIKRSNGLVYVGVVVPFLGAMYYADDNGKSVSVTSGYQVLTCRSCRKNEKKYPTPSNDGFAQPNVDPPGGCVNTWLPYYNDDTPVKNGISAGEYECGNEAYVGKGKATGVFVSGRIQTTPEAGLYLTLGRNIFLSSGVFYLANNPGYTYRWTTFDGTSVPPSNLVMVRNDVGNFAVGVGRVKTNGHMQIGKLVYPVLAVPNDKGTESYVTNFELLVCDPWPKYECIQQWKQFSASTLAVDGLSVDGGVTFVGRVQRKCINGCDIDVGSATTSGVSIVDDLTVSAVNDNISSAEYLVKNANDTYRWLASSSGVQVTNALHLHSEGHVPFYIGMTSIDDRVYVGKVRPGEGLFFIDAEGKLMSTNTYSVLTCHSPDASNGVWEQTSEKDWFGSFGCPARKEWDYSKWRCVCREDFRGLLPPIGGEWNEQTCSYIEA